MHIVVSREDTVIRAQTFDTDVIGIGSDPDTHVHLPDGRIAPQHAKIRTEDDGWVIEPLDFGHALILNAAVVDEPASIKNGDELRLGDFTVTIYLDSELGKTSSKTAMAEDVAKLRMHSLPSGSVIASTDAITLESATIVQVSDFALQLPQCTDFASLLNMIANGLREAFDARLAWVGLRRKTYGDLDLIDGRRRDGKTFTEPPNFKVFRHRCVERLQFLRLPQTDEPETESALAIPLRTERGCVGLLYLDTPPGTDPLGEADLHTLMMYGALITRQYEAVLAGQLHRQTAAVTGELAFLREVQARMDPTMVPQWETLQLAVYGRPGLERVGDLFDVMRVPNGLAAFLIARAEAPTGRAALAMAEVRAAFRMAGMHADPPHIILRALDWLIRADRDPCMLHAAVVVMNPKNGAFEYATAGKMGTIVVDRTGQPRVLNDPAIPALGQGDEYRLPGRSERLDSNETLVAYTPGCRTLTDAAGGRLGVDAFNSALCDGFGQSAVSALDELLADLSAYFRDGRQPDDITMLFVHRA
ncbi:MAG: SpoIIE family protein phosphatase [bacterium]|nr:SpoIIE family protein phosphatase [bacterium]